MSSKETPSKKTPYEEVSSDKERIPIINFETAVNYIAECLLRRKEQGLMIVALYGNPNSGKTHFVSRLNEILKSRDSKKKVFSPEGSSRDEVVKYFQLRDKYREFEFPLVLLQTTDSGFFAADQTSAEVFEALPETVLYIYNPNVENPRPEYIKEQVLTNRRSFTGSAASGGAKFEYPEIIMVQNPDAKEK